MTITDQATMFIEAGVGHDTFLLGQRVVADGEAVMAKDVEVLIDRHRLTKTQVIAATASEVLVFGWLMVRPPDVDARPKGKGIEVRIHHPATGQTLHVVNIDGVVWLPPTLVSLGRLDDPQPRIVATWGFYARSIGVTA